MARSSTFGRLLTEAIYRIVFKESKSVQIVQDELGYALERESGGSAIEYWRKGHVPARQTDIELLAREIVQRSDLGREWLEAFLKSAGFVHPEQLCDALFPVSIPPRPAQLEPVSSAPQPFDEPPIDELAPFVAGPPITNPRQFFGRGDELRRIFNILGRFPLQNIAVIGPQRSGKTSLLHYLRQITSTPLAQLRPGQRRDWLRQPERYTWVFVDFQDARMGSQERLLRHILAELGMSAPAPSDLLSFMDTVSRGLRSPAVILMDEIGAALESAELDQRFWWSMRSLGTNQTGGRLSFIMTSHQPPDQQAASHGKPSPFFNIFQRLDLGPLTEQAARELIASSPQPLPPEDADWIIAQSGRWPALVQILCQTYLSEAGAGATGQAWRAAGLRQIEPYRVRNEK